MWIAIYRWLGHKLMRHGTYRLAGIFLYYYRKWMRELAEERKQLRSNLKKPMTRRQIHEYNALTMVATDGLIGGDDTEKTIKRFALERNACRFRPPQVEQLRKQIDATADDEFSMFERMV